MSMTGDGETQPVEGVDALDDLANSLEPETQPERAAPESEDEAEEGEQEEVAEVSDDDAEEEADEEAGDDPTVKIKHDGKDIEVKLSEALNLAQQGMDYTKKTMAVAEERKAAEAERSKAAEVRTQTEEAFNETLNRMQALTEFMESQVGSPPGAELLSHDAHAYLIQREQHEARKGQLQQAYAALTSLQQEQARQRQASVLERGEATEKVLRDTLPGWNDGTIEELAGYANTIGLSPRNAADAMLEPGFWTLAHKAKAYDAIQAAKAAMKPKETLAKVVKPSAQNQSGKVAERAKRDAAFNKNPSVDALADLLR